MFYLGNSKFDYDSFREYLIEALERDAEVKRAILRLVNENKSEPRNLFNGGIFSQSQDNRTLSNKIEGLEAKVRELNTLLGRCKSKITLQEETISNRIKDISTKDDTISKLKSDISESKDTINSLQSQLSQAKIDNSQLRELNSSFEPFVEVQTLYNRYLNLSDDIHNGLENSICCDSVLQYVVTISQWESIEAIWKYIKYQMDRLTPEEQSVLMDTFNWAFRVYNQHAKKYSMLSVEVGETFDSDYHAKGSNSKSSGTISEVLLLGYKNTINGNVIEKSIVRV